MIFKPHGDGGRIIEGETIYGRLTIKFCSSASMKLLRIVDGDGNQVGEAQITITHPMPPDFDPEQESRRMKQGGCCGQASE